MCYSTLDSTMFEDFSSLMPHIRNFKKTQKAVNKTAPNLINFIIYVSPYIFIWEGKYLKIQSVLQYFETAILFQTGLICQGITWACHLCLCVILSVRNTRWMLMFAPNWDKRLTKSQSTHTCTCHKHLRASSARLCVTSHGFTTFCLTSDKLLSNTPQ